MGLFTSKIKTTITVATQAMRLVPDNQVPESMRTGAVEALVTNQNLSDTVENKLVDLLADSYDCTYHAKRITLFKKDLLLARRIRGKEDNISATLF